LPFAIVGAHGVQKKRMAGPARASSSRVSAPYRRP
jgi:hypothetical protein